MKSLPGVSDDLSKCSSFQILHHDPQLVADQKRVVHFHDVRVVIVAHNDDFIKKEFASLLFPQIHLLDRDLTSSRPLGRDPNSPSRSLADLLEV